MRRLIVIVVVAGAVIWFMKQRERRLNEAADEMAAKSNWENEGGTAPPHGI